MSVYKRKQEGNRIIFLEREQREQIGFSFIIDTLQIMTPYGEELKKSIEPFKNKYELECEFINLESIIKSVQSNKKEIEELERAFCKVKDIRKTIERLKGNIIMDEVELYEIKYFSLLIEEIIAVYKRLNLSISTISFQALEAVVELLDPDKKRLSTFYIYESYSYKLKEIRYEKAKLEEKLFKEKDIEKQKILKAHRLSVVVSEQEEEAFVRKQLTEKLKAYGEIIERDIKALGKLDFLIAKGKLALKYKACKPLINDDSYINFKKMFNPEVAEILERKHKEFTAIDIELVSGVTVITGANMGGKSVALKTILLNLLLGQCGFYVFSEEAYFPVLDFTYFISDDLQSVSQGLSTFGAEIVKVKEAANKVKKKNGLIVLDEFARGTNPKEGFYLVKSLCKYLSMHKTISIISTHYDGVVEENMVHYQVMGLRNVNFELLKHKIDVNKTKSIDILQEHMDYRLEKVKEKQQVPKDALNIATLLGLQEEIINIAKSYYD